MEGIVQAIGLLSGMGSFGKGLGVVAGIVILVLLLRKNKSEEETRRSDRQAKSLNEIQEDYDAERLRRIEADKRGDRYLDALRLWCSWAHHSRHERLNDRQQHIMHETRAGIEPLMLPVVPELPRLTEIEEA